MRARDQVGGDLFETIRNGAEKGCLLRCRQFAIDVEGVVCETCGVVDIIEGCGMEEWRRFRVGKRSR